MTNTHARESKLSCARVTRVPADRQQGGSSKTLPIVKNDGQKVSSRALLFMGHIKQNAIQRFRFKSDRDLCGRSYVCLGKHHV